MSATASVRRGTIGAKLPFHDDEAANLLAELLASKTDADKMEVLRVLTQINNTQRQMIKTPYKLRYSRDLMVDLTDGLSEDCGEIILALMETPTKYDALQLAKAINAKTDVNESLLIEILCLRTNSEIDAIKNEYQTARGSSLETDVAKRVNGDLRDILLSVLQKSLVANNNDIVDVEKIRHCVKKILGEKKKIDKLAMKNIIGSLSAYQLNVLINEYATIAGRQIEHDIENSNAPTREGDLIRLIISRSEIDLATISEAYTSNYKKKLIEEIGRECAGACRHCLIDIIKVFFCIKFIAKFDLSDVKEVDNWK
ncbi:unnamed protein product [Litomosoides sigmodontis]|uniref:Annexin n=1 Tax=Litomosoides sigmodontis TaxID=42156 RepID=A0A3P7JMJ4_LITSI|nr:unnamed protein product [Litomosoides sigmodontis]